MKIELYQIKYQKMAYAKELTQDQLKILQDKIQCLKLSYGISSDMTYEKIMAERSQNKYGAIISPREKNFLSYHYGQLGIGAQQVKTVHGLYLSIVPMVLDD